MWKKTLKNQLHKKLKYEQTIWELIFIYCGLFVLILVVFFFWGGGLCCFFFHYVSAKFHLWPSSGDLPRPRIGIMSLVTVSPVITAFHSCCLSQLWTTTMKGSNYWGYGLQDSSFLSEVAVNHLKKAIGEISPKRSERRNNTKKTTKMRTKSPQ